MAKKEPKRIGIRVVLSWIFSVIFLIAGAGTMIESVPSGFMMILAGLMLFPPFHNFLLERFNVKISGWLSFILAIVFLGLSMAMTPDYDYYSDIDVQPSDDAGLTVQSTEPATNQVQETSKSKVKSGTIEILRTQVTYANLYPARVKVTNTGDVTIYPEFDMEVFDSSNREVCSGSAMFDPFNSISPGESKTDELTFLDCSFDEDGDYTLVIHMLDTEFNALDTDRKEFNVDYWGQYSY